MGANAGKCAKEHNYELISSQSVQVTRRLHRYRIVGMPSAEIQISYCICQSVLAFPAIQTQLSQQEQDHKAWPVCSAEPATSEGIRVSEQHEVQT